MQKNTKFEGVEFELELSDKLESFREVGQFQVLNKVWIKNVESFFTLNLCLEIRKPSWYRFS